MLILTLILIMAFSKLLILMNQFEIFTITHHWILFDQIVL